MTRAICSARPYSLRLNATAIANAVGFAPPENRATGAQINACRAFLSATNTQFDHLEVIVTLEKIAHDSAVRALGGRLSQHPLGHAAESELKAMRIVSSYHCSRYTTNTVRLTPAMFEAVLEKLPRHFAAAWQRA